MAGLFDNDIDTAEDTQQVVDSGTVAGESGIFGNDVENTVETPEDSQEGTIANDSGIFSNETDNTVEEGDIDSGSGTSRNEEGLFSQLGNLSVEVESGIDVYTDGLTLDTSTKVITVSRKNATDLTLDLSPLNPLDGTALSFDDYVNGGIIVSTAIVSGALTQVIKLGETNFYRRRTSDLDAIYSDSGHTTKVVAKGDEPTNNQGETGEGSAVVTFTESNGIQTITIDDVAHNIKVYTVMDGELSQNNFTNALKTQYDAAHVHSGTSHFDSQFGNLTAVPANITALINANSPVFINTTYSVGDGGLTEKNFTTALETKLDGLSENNDSVTRVLESYIRIDGDTIDRYTYGTDENVDTTALELIGHTFIFRNSDEQTAFSDDRNAWILSEKA